MLSDAESISLPWIYHVVGKLDHNNSFLPTGYQLRFPPDQIIAKLKHRITALMNGKPQRQTDHCPVMISHTLLLVIQYYNGSQNCRKDITRYLCPLRLQFYMMTSSNGNIFRITGPLYGEFTGDWWIPPQSPVTQTFDVFFGSAPYKRWINNQDVGDLRRHHVLYGVTVIGFRRWLSF